MQEQIHVVARSARMLVIVAALPFILLSIHVFIWPEYRYLAARALATYSALILCFYGAIHWGIAMKLNPAESPRTRVLIRVAMLWSVIPAALAWFALVLPAQPGRYWLLVALILCLLVDAALALRLKLPSWYMPLHCILTLIACAAQIIIEIAPLISH